MQRSVPVERGETIGNCASSLEEASAAVRREEEGAENKDEYHILQCERRTFRQIWTAYLTPQKTELILIPHTCNNDIRCVDMIGQ